MDRTKGISGTDIAAITGHNPYKTPLDVFLEKTGQAEPKVQTEAMAWGLKLEPLLAERYEEVTGNAVTVFDPPTLKHPSVPWWIGSPDRHLYSGSPQKIIELKTAGERQAWRWGDSGSDDVPPEYLCQVIWYMPLINADSADIAVLLGNREFRVYHINRDRELEALLQEEAERFLKDHVLSGIPPALDGSRSASEYLKRKYPVDSGPMLSPTDPDILADIDRYRENREQLKHIEHLVNMYENRLKAIVGDCGGMEGPWGKITWRKAKDSQTVDWKALAEELLFTFDELIIQDYKRKHTIIKPGSRRWLPRFSKED